MLRTTVDKLKRAVASLRRKVARAEADRQIREDVAAAASPGVWAWVRAVGFFVWGGARLVVN